ncbi:MAG: homocitrate synthase [Deltaproteobacteria bacterium]|nr:homocitrate synthase [Deltaproteobacteria bacterium]
MKESERLVLVDNTLREGEQTPGVAFSAEQKLEILGLLVAAGITFVDAAFPESSEDERRFLGLAALRFPDVALGASCRLRAGSLQLAADSGARELFVVVPVSDMHLEQRLGLDRERLLARMAEALVPPLPARVNVALEDAFRADPTFVLQAVRRAVELGASRIFLADTVGVVLPWEVGGLVGQVLEALPSGTALGTHFHNDFGLATANTLAALTAGATHPTAAVNGLGERAGNSDLAQVAAAAELLLGRPAGVRLDRLRHLSARIAELTGIVVPQTAPLTGFNAFRHTSGIHVHGMLRDRHTYEGADPERFGTEHSLVLGRHSGRRHLRHLLPGLSEKRLGQLLQAVKLRALRRERGDGAAELLDRLDRFNRECLGIGEEELAELLEGLPEDEER